MKLAVNGWRIHGSTGVARYVVCVVQGWTPEVVADRFSEISLYEGIRRLEGSRNLRIAKVVDEIAKRDERIARVG